VCYNVSTVTVATHLGISLDDYDRKIRSFIPQYDVMLSTAAGVVQRINAAAPVIVDLGVGTGALAQACLAVRPDARLCGVDEDAAILDVARSRLGHQPFATFLHGSFLEIALPACDAIVACIALHHVRDATRKGAFYRACRDVLRPGGLLVSADCFPASDPAEAAAQRAAWLQHMTTHYSRDEAEGIMAAWAAEDVYFPLVDELDMLRSANLTADVIWRAGAFAVVAARRH
jgi:tRNA (cmo5U34)-methyltransferase